jgi:hypothetical protein
MAKNLIPEIVQMLGVELGEEFKIKGYSEAFMITPDKGLIATDDDSETETEWIPANILFVALLNGEEAIVKLPWQPKNGEVYYTYNFSASKWVVCSSWWGGSPSEYALFDKGWVYRTREEAQAALPAVAAEIGVEYKL